MEFLFFRFLIKIFLIILAVLSVSSIKISCDYAAVNYIISECTVRRLEVKEPNETVTSISGTLSSVIDYENITTFKVESSPRLEYLPAGIEKFFPNLRKIEVSETGLKVLTQDNLKSFPKLKSLVVRENQLEYLDTNVFEFNDVIEEIDLSGNKLNHLPANSLRVLKNLRKLDLANNVCINETAHNVKELRNLKTKLSEKCVKSVPINSWSFVFNLLLVLFLAVLFVFLLIFCMKNIVK